MTHTQIQRNAWEILQVIKDSCCTRLVSCAGNQKQLVHAKEQGRGEHDHTKKFKVHS